MGEFADISKTIDDMNFLEGRRFEKDAKALFLTQKRKTKSLNTKKFAKLYDKFINQVERFYNGAPE